MRRDAVNVEHEVLKCMIILVIIGAKGTMTSALKKNLEAIQVKKSVDSLQKQLSLEHHT